MEFFTRITSTLSIPQAEGGDVSMKKNAVIMGIRTYMCIPPRFRPLKGRVNVVLSRTATETPAGAAHLFRSLSDAIETLSTLPEIDQLYVIGGESVYTESVTRPDCQFIFLTRIDADFECDRFFPEIDLATYQDLTDESVDAPGKAQILKQFDIPMGIQTENNLSYKYQLYQRISSQ